MFRLVYNDLLDFDKWSDWDYGGFMKDFVYVTKKEKQKVKKELIDLINLVQDEVRKYFTFSYEFIGSDSRNMITYDRKSNIGYDFDVNIRVNDDDDEYEAKDIRKILKNGFDKYSHLFQYDYCEDSTRVLTIKVKDRKNSRILHSCDFAVVYDCDEGRQQYIRFNKNQNSYYWEYQPKGYYQLPERIEWCKQNNLWGDGTGGVRDRYIEKKNNNTDPNKKSRSIFAETVNEIYNQYLI